MHQAPSTKHQEQGASHDNEVLVIVGGVSKKFCRDLKKSLWYGVKDVAAELNPFGSNRNEAQGTNHNELPRLRDGEFWAVKDVSFELRRGECLGLIGHNGAGKTTLLKMLNGLLKPDSGSIEMRGRVGALIALGAGFNPILTGRENIYVNGSVLGLTKSEIDDKIRTIIEFSGIHEFIDSPVQSYSSGMVVRLGFSIATSFQPDVLILDEVLAVGDFHFRMKCYERMAEVRERSAVIFVSHQLDQLRRLCTCGVHLKSGACLTTGTFDEVAASYEADTLSNGTEIDQDHLSSRIQSASIRIKHDVVRFGDPLQLDFKCTSFIEFSKVSIRIAFATTSDDIVAEWCSTNHSKCYSISPLDRTEHSIVIPRIPLRPGTYKIRFMVTDVSDSHYLVVLKRNLKIQVTGDVAMKHNVQL